MEEVSFDSLPFLFSDGERSVILAYKQKAIEKEQELTCRRRDRIEQLRSIVRQKIANAEARKLLRCDKSTPPVRTEQRREELPACRERQTSLFREQHVPPYGLQYGKLQTISRESLSQHSDIKNRIAEQCQSSCVPYKVSQKLRQDVYMLVSAAAKGFLVRRLLCTEKVKEVVTTIKDASAVLKSIERSGDQQDRTLQSRVQAQLQVAKVKLHNVFFTVPVAQRMMYIAHSRQLRQQSGKDRRNKPGGTMRLSSATLKSLNRRSGLKDTIPRRQQPSYSRAGFK